MHLLFAALAAVVMTLSGPSQALAAGERHPVVMELFTSQGCSSCPPADKILAHFAGRDNILALSYHVDYWNRLGWEDPYSLEAATQRQYGYAEATGRRVYTPQLIVQGGKDVVGANERAVAQAVVEAGATDKWFDITLAHDGGQVTIHAAPQGSIRAELLLIGYTKHTENTVPRGENAGARLSHRNTVTEVRKLGEWDGRALDLTTAAPEKGDGVAVIAQMPHYGAIIGGGWTDAR